MSTAVARSMRRSVMYPKTPGTGENIDLEIWNVYMSNRALLDHALSRFAFFGALCEQSASPAMSKCFLNLNGLMIDINALKMQNDELYNENARLFDLRRLGIKIMRIAKKVHSMEEKFLHEVSETFYTPKPKAKKVRFTSSTKATSGI